MRRKAEEAELEPLMPTMETISRRICFERLVMLKRAMNDIECRKATDAATAQLSREILVISQA